MTDQMPPRMPLHEFVRDAVLLDAFRRGVRAMKARKPSDPLSWFYQAAIHGVTDEMVQVQAVADPDVLLVDKGKYWNQCPHFKQESANFLPWHRGYTYYFERILRAHTGEPRFALPYWEYARTDYRFPREFGTHVLSTPLDGDSSNPLWYDDRNLYFASWEHPFAPDGLPYSRLTEQAVDWSVARDQSVFFGETEGTGLAGAVKDQDPRTRGRLESYPHDPIHRLTGIIVPEQVVPDPDHPGQTITRDGYALGMSSPPTAGFDPIFCVHHSNIDRLWSEWSLMAGKSWGAFPPQSWFDERAWYFFDVVLDADGTLRAIERNLERKRYFDSRALGITFKYEDLGKEPLRLPDPVPAPSLAWATPASFARLIKRTEVAGASQTAVGMAPIASEVAAQFRAVQTGAVAPKRILMRINGTNLSAIAATGFDVYLTNDPNASPRRSDPSFLGSIALFRHDHANSGAGHGGHGGHGHGVHGHHGDHETVPASSDTFDVTRAVAASGESDPSRLHVLIVPYSLSATTKDGADIVETRSLLFEGIEFFAG